MVGIGRRTNVAFSQQIIDDPLNVLSASSHVARQPRDRLRAFRRDDCTQHLPPRTRQSKGGN